MRNFYKILLLTTLFLNIGNNAFANTRYYDIISQNSFTPATSTYCMGGTATPLSVVWNTCNTIAAGGVGGSVGSTVTVTWYTNTTASTNIGTANLVAQYTAQSTGTGGTVTYTYTPLTATAGTLYYFCVLSAVNNAGNTYCAGGLNTTTETTLSTSATVQVVVNAALTYTSSSTDQYATSNIDLNCTDVTNAIQEIKVVVATGGACTTTITQFNLTTAGSTNAATDITKARIYYTGQTQGYNPFNFFGSVNNPNGTFTITGSQALLLGAGTYYFYVCYDIASTATSGDVVDVTLNSFTYCGSTISNMSPNPVVSVTLGGGACHVTPDLPNPTSNIQTVTAGSLIIPMDNSHQNLWKTYAFNTKAYGLVRALLMQDIPVKWIIKSGKTKDSSDFSAVAARIYPTSVAAALQYFKAGEFEVDTTYLARSVYPGEQNATQVISTFATRWKVAVYKLSSNTSVDVRYTLNHRPKIALFNNGGYQSVQLAMLDSAKVWTSPNVDTALSAGSFSGLAECYTFCSESHWDNATAPLYPADTSVLKPVYQFIEEGGNFLAQCAGIDKYENQMQPTRHFQSSHGIVDQNKTFPNNYYSNPDMAFSQFQGAVVPRSGIVSSFELASPADTSVWHPEMYQCVRSGDVTGDTIIASGVHLGNPDSVGGNVFYLAGHDYQTNTTNGDEIGTLSWINGARLYLNAVFVPANRPDPTPLQAGSNVTICQGQTTKLGGSPTGPSSGGGTVYTWSPSTGLDNPNSANPNATPTVTTTYTVFVNSSGCAYTPASVVVTVIPTPATPTITDNSPVCQGATLNLSASTVTGATYSWTGPNSFTSTSQTPSITNVTSAAAGTYSVVASISGCPGVAGTGAVTINITPTVSLSAPPTICSGGSTTLTASGATTYTWTPNTNLSATTGSSVSANPTTTTTYSVTGTTGGCASATATVVVTVNTTPTVTLSAPPTICSGNSTTLTASGATTYTWSPNTNLSATTGSSVSASPTSTITYSVTGTTGGCASATATVVVTVNATPTVTLSAPPTICSGNSTTLTASGATTYAWSPNTNLSATTGSSVSANPTTTTTYSVTGTTGGCTSATKTIVVTVNTTPTITLSAPPTICSGNSTTLTASGATNYTWSPNTNLSATTGSSVSASPNSTTTYSVTGTTNSCPSAVATVVVTVNTTPTVTLSAPSTICSGNSTTLTASGATTYTWSPNTNLSATTGSSVSANPNATTTYSVAGTTGGCTSSTATVVVTVNTTPTVTLSAPPTICSGGSTTLSASGATTYTWSPNTNLSATTGSSVSANPSSTTTYSVTGTTTSCPSAVATVVVTVNTTPTVTLSAPPTICSGNSTTLTASGATTYTWSPNTNLSATTGSSVSASPNSTTTYSVTGTTNSCPSAVATVVVTVNTTPTVTLSAPPTICSGNSTTLTASGATTYTWSPNINLSATTGTSVSANPTTTTTYSVTGTTNSCPSAVATVLVTVNTTPTVTLSAPPTICSGNSTTLTASGATTYIWSPNTNLSATTGASVSASPNSTTTYSVTGTTNSCPSAVQTVVVTVNTTPTVTLSAPPTICPGNSTTLTASGATTYAWSPNTNLSATTGSSVSANPNSTTTYSVTGTTNSCPSAVQTIVVTVTSAPTVTLSSPPTICSGTSTTLTASGATTYTWSPNTNLSATTGSSVIANPTSTITYTVVGTTGCPGTPATIVVTVNSIPAAPTAGSNTPLCIGSTLNLTASNVASATYSWSGPNSFTSSSQNPSVSGVVVADGGTYSVTVTVNGCTGPAGTTAVVVNPPPPAPTAGSNSPVCTGTKLTLTASTTPSATYAWSGPNSFTSTSQNPFINGVTMAAGGTYSVTATVPGCATSPAGIVSVTVNPTPAAPTAGSNSPICAGATLNLTASTIAGATYSWSGPSGFTSTSQSPSISNIIAADAGTYSVTATAIGCTGAAGTTSVTVNPIPATPTAGSNSPICLGGAINLTSSNVTGASYSWSGPNGFTSSSQNPSISTSVLADSGVYSVNATVAGCTGSNGTVDVHINPPPAAPTAGSNSPVCSGTPLNLTANTIANATYNWTGPNTFSSTSQNPTIASVTLAGAGTYSVTATVPGCTTSPAGTVSVVVNPTPVAPTAGSNSPVCNGSSINLTASTVAGSTYTWSGPNGFTSTSQNPSIATATSSSAGIYSVTVTNTASGCTGPAGTTNVVITPIPAAPTAGSNGPICAGATLNLTASNISSATYNWSGPNGFTSSSQNPSISNATTAASGTYSVTATVSGCAGPAGTVNVTVNPIPAAPTASSNSPVCTGATLNLMSSAVAGASYNWTGPLSFTSYSQDTSINNTTTSNSGTYSVTVTIAGCTGPAGTVSALVSPIPAAPTAGSNSPICEGSTLNLTAGNITGASYNWSGPNSFTSTSQNPAIASATTSATGTYSVNVTVAGCAGPAGMVNVTVNPIPTAPTVGSNTPVCSGQVLNLTASTITGATYSWSGPNTFTSSSQNPSINNVTTAASGTYSVAVSVSGCGSVAGTTTVVINATPAAPVASSNGPLCSGSTLNLSASNTGTTYSWSGPNSFTSTSQTPSINNVTTANAGTYSVTATANGCIGSAGVVTVAINDPAIVNAGSNQTVCANNDSVKLSGTSSTGSAKWTSSGSGIFSPNNTTLNATYVPSNADTTAGSVTLTLTSKNNGACSPVTSTITVTFTHAPTVNAGPNQTVCGNNASVSLNGSYTVASGAVWSTSGTGTFSPNNTTMNATYVPSSADTTAGTVTLTLTTTGNGQCKVVSSKMKITITHAPNINAGSNVSACKNNADVSLNGTSSTGSGTWTTSGTGTFSPNNTTLNATYVSSSADTAAGSVKLTLTSGNNGTCTPVSQSITVTYTPIPKVNAGPDITVCANNDSIKLNGTSATGAGQWTTSGSGTFSPNNTTLNPTYVPSNADTTSGSVTLTLTSANNATCLPVSDQLAVHFTHAPTVNAGSNVSVCSNNSNVALNGSYTVASGAIWSTSGTGVFTPNNTTMNAVYVPSSADTAAKLVTITLTTTGNGQCKAVSSAMTITYTNAPHVEAGADTKVCLSSPDYTLSGYSSTGSGTWTSLGSGTFTPNANTLGATYKPSSADTAGKTVTLILTSTNNASCNSVSDSVVLTYTKIPVVTAGSNQTVCANNDNITLNGTSTTGTGKWTSTGTGTFTPNANTLNATYVPSNADTAAGSVKLTLTATGGCSPVTSSIVVTITHAPYVNAGPDQAVCRNNAVVTLNGQIGGATTTGIWSTSGSGTFSPDNTTMGATYTPSTADTTAGSVKLVLTSTGNGSCMAVADTTMITYTKIPVVSAGPGQTVCANNDSVQLVGASTSGSGQWTSSGTGTFVPNNNTLNAKYLPSNADTTAGSVTLTLTSTNNGGCNPVTNQMVITINHAPVVNAGPDQTVCANNAVTSLTGSVSNAGGVQWNTTGSGTFSPNNTTLNTTYIPSAADTTAKIVKLSLITTGNGLCKAVTDTMVLTITPAPDVNAGADASVCVSSPDYTLNGTSSTGSGTWSTLGDGTFSPNNTILNAKYIPGTNDTTSGSVKLVLASANNGTCLAVTDTMIIKYDKRPSDNAGSDVTVCANKDTVSLSGTSSTGSGIWNTSGTGVFSPNNNVLNAIYVPSNSDTALGSVTLKLTTSNNGACSSATSQLVVTITPAPYVNAGPDQVVCGNADVNLSGSVNSVASGAQWSTSGGGTFSPNATTLNATYIPSTADTTAHSVKLILTTTGNGQCRAASDTMIVTINSAPVVNAGPDITVCLSNPDYKLNGTSSTGSGTWTTSGTGSFNPNANTLNATYIPSSADTTAHTVTLVLTSANNGGCSSSSDTIVLKYSTNPSANAGPDQTVCANNAAITLNGASGSGSGVWSTNGTGTFSPNATSLNTTYISSSADTTAKSVILTLTTTGGCSPASNSMTVTFTPAPFANAGANQFACRNNPDVTLSGYVGGGASTGTWSTLGSGSFTPNANTLGATYVPSSADTSAGSVKLVLTTTNNGTCLATSDTMKITFTAPPSVYAGKDTSGCANNLVSINGKITGGSGTGIWSTPNGSGTFSPGNTTLATNYIPGNGDTLVKNVVLVLTTTNNGNCTAVSDTMIVKVSPGPVVNAGPDQTVCSNNANVTLAGSVKNASGGQWNTTGSGTFTPNTTTLNATYVPSATDITGDSVKLVLSSTGNGLCYTATDTMKVIFSPAPKVNAGADIYICTGSSTATLSGSVSGGSSKGKWSTMGTGTFSPNDSALNGTYNLSTSDTIAKSVKLVLTSLDNGNCSPVSDTVIIRIAPVPTANAGADTIVCASTSAVPVHGTITGGSGTGIWKTLGTGSFTPSDSILSTNYIPSSADTSVHSVKLVLTTTKSCLAVSDTMVIHFNSAPVAHAGTDQTVCSNNANVMLAGGVSNAGGGRWSTTGSGTFTPNDSALNATYISSSADTAAKTVKIILATTGNGLCTSANDTIVITYSPSPKVNAGADIYVCTGNTTASLNGSVSGGATTGKWTTMGTGTFTPNDSALNATYNLSTADTVAKTVKLVLTSTNNGGCISVSDTVVVRITPVPVVNAGMDTTVCANSNLIPLHGTVTGGVGAGVWKTLGSGTFTPNDSMLNAKYMPGSADTIAKTVKLVLSAIDACTPVSDTMVITFTPAPKANAGADQAICAGSDVVLNGKVTLASGGKWSTIGTGIFTPNDSTLNGTYIPGSADVTAGKVSLILTTTGNGGCFAGVDTMVVTIQSKPVANFTRSVACSDSIVTYKDASTVSSGVITSWNWNLGNGTSTLQNPTATYSGTGMQTVTLIASTSAGCSDTVTKQVYVNPLPVATFTYTTFCPDSADFTDRSTVNPGGIAGWDWMFGDSTTSTQQNPSHGFPKTSTYLVTLMATSDSGCKASHTDTLILVPCSTTVASTPGVPSAFTPNGDGNNDVLYVRGGPFSLFDFRVFNEWGTQVFQANVQSDGWDGKFRGSNQPEGTFVWTLTGTTIDGKQVKMTGNVTILR